MRLHVTLLVLALAQAVWAGTTRPSASQPAKTEFKEDLKAVRAVISTEHGYYNTNDPVWIDMMLVNTSDQPVTLHVPGAEPGVSKDTAMGLSVDHVFSGERFRALWIVDGSGKELGRDVMMRPADKVPPVTLAPHGVVGARLEMGQYYTSLRRSGMYLVEWHPYGGAVKSNSLRLEIRSLKDLVLTTNFGPIRMTLLYDKAPNHVASFLDLAQTGFYNRQRFYRLFRGVAIMGGCPNNDGSGLRKDGRTLKPEFNDTPFDEGTVAMSLAGDDVNSASCQFFICLRRIKLWDGKYTAFAKVVGQESLETIRKIGQLDVDADDSPVQEVILERISLVEATRDKALQESVPMPLR